MMLQTTLFKQTNGHANGVSFAEDIRPAKRKAWQDLLPNLAQERTATRPRLKGLTMILDRCLGLRATEDLLELTGDYIDLIKLSFGTSMFLDEELLRRKINLVLANGIDIFPGGTLMEAMLVHGVYPEYVKRARELGFTALEISDGTITMSRQTRNDAIQRALDAGFWVISEVGKKDQSISLSPTEIADQIAADLAAGADRVIIEARESGTGIGIYDQQGNVRQDEMTSILNLVGKHQDRIIWEAPQPKQQAALIVRGGPNVNLGNVKPNDVLGLEALRGGLRFETFQNPAAQLLKEKNI
jgi:phosphosulfolactate synthase